MKKNIAIASFSIASGVPTKTAFHPGFAVLMHGRAGRE
jgi:hypothetical protein